MTLADVEVFCGEQRGESDLCRQRHLHLGLDRGESRVALGRSRSTRCGRGSPRATLARHYRVQRDATGQYLAFRRLHSLRPQDPAIANNYAFFAALTGKDSSVARKLADEIHAADAADQTYRATLAFVLLKQDRPTESLNLLRPVATQWKLSPPSPLPTAWPRR